MNQTSAQPPPCHPWHSLFFCWRLLNSIALLRVPPSGLGVNLFVVRSHVPNRDACTVTVRYEYMCRATPNIQYTHILCKQKLLFWIAINRLTALIYTVYTYIYIYIFRDVTINREPVENRLIYVTIQIGWDAKKFVIEVYMNVCLRGTYCL